MLSQPRALLTALHRAAVEGAEPFARTREAVAQWISAHGASLRPPARIHLIGVGKASIAMTAGAVRALHNADLRPQHGIVVCASANSDQAREHARQLPPSFTMVEGDHPIPGPASLRAAQLIDEAVRAVQSGDIALVLVSGGTTALTAAPVAELSQIVGDEDKAQAHLANLADTLLESGLAIHEMNAIRRRMLRWGAGRLAVALAERGAARIPVFAISDVIGDDPSVIGSGPCSPDPLDEATFLALLDAHDIRNALQRDTALFLGIAGTGRPPAVPSPTHQAFALVDYQLVARNRDAVHALATAARASGITHVIEEVEPLEGDAAQLGDRLARYAIARARLLAPGESALLAFGGEPVVNLRAVYERAWDDGTDSDGPSDGLVDVEAMNTIIAGNPLFASPPPDEPMRGGRMQLLALSASFALEEAAASGDDVAWRITLLAAGTDGRDGPTDAAGAIVDAVTPAMARREGRRPEHDLATGRSWFPLHAAEALVRSGPTGTNVMDVVAVLIKPVRS